MIAVIATYSHHSVSTLALHVFTMRMSHELPALSHDTMHRKRMTNIAIQTDFELGKSHQVSNRTCNANVRLLMQLFVVIALVSIDLFAVIIERIVKTVLIAPLLATFNWFTYDRLFSLQVFLQKCLIIIVAIVRKAFTVTWEIIRGTLHTVKLTLAVGVCVLKIVTCPFVWICKVILPIASRLVNRLLRKHC